VPQPPPAQLARRLTPPSTLARRASCTLPQVGHEVSPATWRDVAGLTDRCQAGRAPERTEGPLLPKVEALSASGAARSAVPPTGAASCTTRKPRADSSVPRPFHAEAGTPLHQTRCGLSGAFRGSKEANGDIAAMALRDIARLAGSRVLKPPGPSLRCSLQNARRATGEPWSRGPLPEAPPPRPGGASALSRVSSG